MCSLTPDDFRTLAERTEGCALLSLNWELSFNPFLIYSYSGSDIASVVKDALMRPIRPALAASHFKRTESNASHKWTPCSPSDPGAVAMTWKDVPSNKLLEPSLTTVDFLLSLER